LFEEVEGSVLEGYLSIRQRGKNVPPMWAERTRESRKNLHKDVARILKRRNLMELPTLREWERLFEREWFYRGVRALLELERNGKTRV